MKYLIRASLFLIEVSVRLRWKFIEHPHAISYGNLLVVHFEKGVCLFLGSYDARIRLVGKGSWKERVVGKNFQTS